MSPDPKSHAQVLQTLSGSIHLSELNDPVHAALDAGIAALDLCASLLAKSQWQPMETAPKDGTAILVARHVDLFGWITGYATYQTLSRIGGGWIARGFGIFGELGLGEPTHWMPLPDPPAMLKGETR